MGVCNCSMFCCTLLYVHSSIAIILMGKRELIALLNLYSWCLVMVERLFLAVPRSCLQFVIVVIPDHTHLLFFRGRISAICTTFVTLKPVLTFQVTFKMHLEPPEALLQPDLENIILSLILAGDCGGLQQNMLFCKLQSVLHVQHENKALNTGLSVQRIATDLEICLYGLQNHCVGSKNPEFHCIILSH